MNDFQAVADRVEIEALRGEFTDPASAERLERVATALRANGFAAEILDDATAARARVKDLVPEGASVLTGASETLRLSGMLRVIRGEHECVIAGEHGGG